MKPADYTYYIYFMRFQAFKASGQCFIQVRVRSLSVYMVSYSSDPKRFSPCDLNRSNLESPYSFLSDLNFLLRPQWIRYTKDPWYTVPTRIRRLRLMERIFERDHKNHVTQQKNTKYSDFNNKRTVNDPECLGNNNMINLKTRTHVYR